MLALSGLRAGYGATPVLHGIDLELAPSECAAVLGRNGVGKTTLMRAVTGAIATTGGSIRFDGTDLGALKAHQRARLGISLVPQGREIFPKLTVLENLRVGTAARRDRGVDAVDAIFEEFPMLAQRRRTRGGSLSGGQQQLLALARALVTAPRLLLLDEPSEGIQPSVLDEIAEVIARINANGASRCSPWSRTSTSRRASLNARSSWRRVRSSLRRRPMSCAPTGHCSASIWPSRPTAPQANIVDKTRSSKETRANGGSPMRLSSRLGPCFCAAAGGDHPAEPGPHRRRPRPTATRWCPWSRASASPTRSSPRGGPCGAGPDGRSALAKGDRVGIWSPNYAEWVLVQYATARIGAILVTINPAYRSSELEYVLKQSGTSVLVAVESFLTSDYRAMIDEVWDRVPAQRTIYLHTPDWDGLLDAGAGVTAQQLDERTAEARARPTPSTSNTRAAPPGSPRAPR